MKKIALLTYDIGVTEQSFYVKNGHSFKLATDEPYNLPGNTNNQIARNIWNIPFVFDGYYINYDHGLPKIDLDIIFAVCEIGYAMNYRKPFTKKIEKRIKYFPRSVNKLIKQLRSQYKNALIIAYSKEVHPFIYWDRRLTKFFNLCDAAAMPYQDKVIANIQNKINHKIFSMPYPYKIDTLREMFLPKHHTSTPKIFVGASKSRDILHGKKVLRGYQNSLDFANYLAQKYGCQVIDQSIKRNWFQWLDEITNCLACINIDPTPRIGQLPIECAILKTPHLGSQLDAAKELFPDTATCDLEKLEQQFKKIINGDTQALLEYASKKVYQRYSYTTARENLERILNHSTS